VAVRDFRELVRIRVPRQNFPARLSVQNPPQKGSTTTTATFRLSQSAARRIWRPLAKPKEACNFKDLKGLKCRYTFGIRAELSSRCSWHAVARHSRLRTVGQSWTLAEIRQQALLLEGADGNFGSTRGTLLAREDALAPNASHPGPRVTIE